MKTRALAPVAIAAALLLTLAGCTGDTPKSANSKPPAASEDGTSDLVPLFVDAPKKSAATVNFSGTSIDPATVTLHSGDVVTFTSGDGGTYGLVINQLSSVTVANGLNEYFQFNDAGKYYVSDEITGSKALITVE